MNKPGIYLKHPWWLVAPAAGAVGVLVLLGMYVHAIIPIPLDHVTSFETCWHYTSDGWGKDGINGHVKFLDSGAERCELPDGRSFTQ